ncbi:MAG TPA: hypothetical protein VL443_20430 [Cyclobacteriaceae bacterium]|jgi:hypothetical protein|nr:hypothetical protein [Cyclobacteriaceae bacterium]
MWKLNFNLHFFLLFILGAVLYVGWGTILTWFLTRRPQAEIKSKVLLYTFGQPIGYWIILFTIFSSLEFQVRVFLSSVTLLNLILELLFSSRRYLIQLEIRGDKLQVKYLTPLLKKQTVEFDCKTTTDLRLDRQKWWNYPVYLKITEGTENFKFAILDKAIHTDTFLVSSAINKNGGEPGNSSLS